MAKETSTRPRLIRCQSKKYIVPQSKQYKAI